MTDLYGPKGPRGRGRRLITPLRIATALTVALAGAAAVLPDPWNGPAEVGVVAVLIGIPIARVGFLTGRWWQIGDRRFAVRGAIMIGVLAAGLVVGLL